MSTGQTLCNSCGANLTDEEMAAPSRPEQSLICEPCRAASKTARRGGWQPVMQWDARDGFRLASTAPIPWKDSNVAMLRISRDGLVRTAHALTGKRSMLLEAEASDLLLAAWPGSRRQDVFIINNRAVVRKALA